MCGLPLCVCVCVSAILDYFDRQSADRTCSIKMESTRAKVIIRGKRQVFVTPLCTGSSSIQTVSGFCGSEEASGLLVVGKILFLRIRKLQRHLHCATCP